MLNLSAKCVCNNNYEPHEQADADAPYTERTSPFFDLDATVECVPILPCDPRSANCGELKECHVVSNNGLPGEYSYEKNFEHIILFQKVSMTSVSLKLNLFYFLCIFLYCDLFYESSRFIKRRKHLNRRKLKAGLY